MTDPRSGSSADREALPVELVDESGRSAGTLSVSLAHQPPGRLHRAFSVLLFDRAGRVLIQQRAAVKTRFPLQWANTCCGHPAPGQPVLEAGRVRLGEELGLTAELREAGTFTYRAGDPGTGRVEYEYDHVLVGTHTGPDPVPDPDEVAAFAWTDPAELAEAVRATPEQYTPWLAEVLDIAVRAYRTAGSAAR
ncbi:isopentenyl-diphosphate Delta-isomerase [Nocardia thailandica]|uniref:isopentenyl-diphosphate Delta-isomerase n=1 Tax=Nocardia thailandica TaxID=257275 RepID=UPI0002F0AC72|nr:isopentenyl-diphosphate Delta-isomerase [Nocardia thailandica]